METGPMEVVNFAVLLMALACVAADSTVVIDWSEAQHRAQRSPPGPARLARCARSPRCRSWRTRFLCAARRSTSTHSLHASSQCCSTRKPSLTTQPSVQDARRHARTQRALRALATLPPPGRARAEPAVGYGPMRRASCCAGVSAQS